jgi:hypothetical protein
MSAEMLMSREGEPPLHVLLGEAAVAISSLSAENVRLRAVVTEAKDIVAHARVNAPVKPDRALSYLAALDLLLRGEGAVRTPEATRVARRDKPLVVPDETCRPHPAEERKRERIEAESREKGIDPASHPAWSHWLCEPCGTWHPLAPRGPYYQIARDIEALHQGEGT